MRASTPDPYSWPIDRYSDFLWYTHLRHRWTYRIILAVYLDELILAGTMFFTGLYTFFCPVRILIFPLEFPIKLILKRWILMIQFMLYFNNIKKSLLTHCYLYSHSIIPNFSFHFPQKLNTITIFPITHLKCIWKKAFKPQRRNFSFHHLILTLSTPLGNETSEIHLERQLHPRRPCSFHPP